MLKSLLILKDVFVVYLRIQLFPRSKRSAFLVDHGVVSLEDDHDDHEERERECSDPEAGSKAYRVFWGLCRDKDIGRYKVGAVAKAELESGSHGLISSSSQICGEHTDVHGHCGESTD